MASHQSKRRHKELEELSEPREVLEKKVRKLAGLLLSSNYAVVYTGAGISTAAGIPDFRGPSGVWTLRAKGKQLPEPDFLKMQPTFSHKALKVLMDRGQVHHIVSQNIDGLHLKSGVPATNLSELHGNYCVETCQRCRASYSRQYAVWSGLTASTQPKTSSSIQHVAAEFAQQNKLRRGEGKVGAGIREARLSRVKVADVSSTPVPDHRTGRICETDGCNGNLTDSVILFGEDLPSEAIDSASEESVKADLSLVLGSSLRVRPACDLPATVLDSGGKLVIVNLQRTPLDARASLVIHAPCDDVMHMLLDELNIDINNSPFDQPKIEDGENQNVKDNLDPEAKAVVQMEGSITQSVSRDCKGLDEHDNKLQEFECDFRLSVGQRNGEE